MTATITPAAAVTVQPQTPWSTPRAKQLQSLGTLIVAGVVAGVVVLFTGVAGIDGWAVTFFGLSLVLAVVRTAKVGSKERTDQLMKVVVASAAVAAFTPWLSIFGSVILKGYVGVRPNYFTQDMSTTVPDDFLEFGGAIHAIVGSLLMVVIATVITLPLGILSGVYLTEVRGKLSFLVRFVIQSMSGVPSIVAGLFIYTTLVFATDTFSGMAGALALAVLMLPTVIKTTDEALKLVPNELRWGAIGIGASKFVTVVKVTLPAAFTPIATGVVLGIARAAGETAPLIFTALFSPFWPDGLFNPIATMSVLIFNFAIMPYEAQISLAWAASFVLVVMILGANLFARWLGRFTQA